MTIATARRAEQTRTIVETDLLNAIADVPEEDTYRLKYADWLEENGNGSRAEFIRAQCELAQLTQPTAAEFMHLGAQAAVKALTAALMQFVVRRDDLRARESALLAAHAAEWRCPRVCERCAEWEKRTRRDLYCVYCHGLGRVGVLGEREIVGGVGGIGDNPSSSRWRIPVEWVRGFPRISCPVAWWCEPARCPKCDSYGGPCNTCERSDYVRDYPNARRAWEEMGMLSLQLTDVQPNESYGTLHELVNNRSFGWCHPEYFDQGILPKPLFLEMCKLYPSRMADTKREYHPCARLEFATEAAARAAADHTAAVWARGLAMGEG